jgi:hypothetical protein
MPYAVYKLIHFLGIFTLLTTFAASSLHVLLGGTRADHPFRRVLGPANGLAAFLVLLGGFGMLARLGVSHGALPMWIWLKLGVWTLFLAALWLVFRGPVFARALMVAVPLLALLAAAIALYKPLAALSASGLPPASTTIRETPRTAHNADVGWLESASPPGGMTFSHTSLRA